MYFKDVYKPIPLAYNFMVGILWHHPELAEGVKAKVVHYCAPVSLVPSFHLCRKIVPESLLA